MADISPEISAFQNAVYGEEVRGSMISLAEKLNDVCEDTESTVGTLEAGYDAAMAAAASATDAASNAASNATNAAVSASSAATSANSAASNATSKANAAQALSDGISAAETARASAETARRSAETSRANAEAARVTAETARAGAEANRQSAELTRQESETARNSAEISRVSAEATRSANETQRQSNESTRQSAESNRSTIFAQMQNAFDDMSQQVLPPATTSTIGGVIVGGGLSVAADGTLSFEAGDFLTEDEAAATYATITTVSGKADAQHVHPATDVTSGTLAVARGGTGVTTAAAERERLGLGSTTDALPVANGGTGATTAANARTALDVYSTGEVDTALGNKANASALDDKADVDHTILGHYSVADPNEDYAVVVGNGTGDAARSNAFTVGWDGKVCNHVDGMSASSIPGVSPTYYDVLSAIDGDGAERGLLRLGDFNSGNQAFQILTRRNVNGTDVNNAITLGIDSNGSRHLGLSDPSIWQNVLFVIENDGMNVGYNQTISAEAANSIKTVDQNGKTAAQIVFKETSAGLKQVQIQAHGYNSSNADVWNSLAVNISKDGTRSYTITDPSAFCEALHVGDFVSNDQSSAVSVANSTWVNVTSLSLAAGTWVISAVLQFSSNSTGRRTIALSSASGTPSQDARRQGSVAVRAVEGDATYISITSIRVLSSSGTVYVKGHQNSGSAINTYAYANAVRLK